MVKIEAVLVGEHQANCYLVENLETHEVFIVDPGAEGQRIIQAVGSRKPVAALATHGHYDHIGGADEVCSHFGIPFYAHREDISKLMDPAANGSRMFAQDLVINTQALPLEEGQKLDLAGLEVTVMHTPGHSRGSCCFLLPEAQGVLCGDTLFLGGYGRTDIADGSFPDLKKSLRRLLFEVSRQVAYPGHGPTTFAGQDVGL